jgi:hypothetical protein
VLRTIVLFVQQNIEDKSKSGHISYDWITLELLTLLIQNIILEQKKVRITALPFILDNEGCICIGNLGVIT